MSILETIVAHKKKEIECCKDLVPVDELQDYANFSRKTLSLKQFLVDVNKTGIIAEFKRKSPSKGIINDSVPIEVVIKGFSKAGASALSVLTDFNFFGGSVDDLLIARENSQIPLLRKDFIIDEYQVYEAKAVGADAVLLIASILTKGEAYDLAKLAHDLGLEVLMEFHNESELDILNEYTDLAGINNRDLKSFQVDLQHSVAMSLKIPNGFLKISESGISSPEDIVFLLSHGYKGFLIGEQFMKASDPVLAFTRFVNSLKSLTNDR